MNAVILVSLKNCTLRIIGPFSLWCYENPGISTLGFLLHFNPNKHQHFIFFAKLNK